jgi:hypothetical protein
VTRLGEFMPLWVTLSQTHLACNHRTNWRLLRIAQKYEVFM